MHTRATSAALKDEVQVVKEGSAANGTGAGTGRIAYGKPAAVPKRALGDITNLAGNGNGNAITFPAKKPTANATHSHSHTDAATKIRRTVATKVVSSNSTRSRQSKAAKALEAAVCKEMPMLDGGAQSERSTTSTLVASPMSTCGGATLRTPRRAHAKLRKQLQPQAQVLAEEDAWVGYCGEPLPAGVRNIDADDVLQGQHLREARFAVEIHRNLQRREANFMPHCDYMANQEDITVKMRAILIDWLVDVHLKFKLQPETLHLTVNIIDRFLERQPVLRRKLQLVGVTAMLIACKYEEIFAPVCRDFVYISDKAYSEEEILKMEAIMLNKLGFCLTVPSALTFLHRSLKALRYADRSADHTHVAHLAHYCVELSMQDGRMLAYRPSEIAAASVLLAMRLVHGSATPRWCATMQFHTGGFEAHRLVPCERELQRVLLAENDPNRKLNAIKRKFAGARYGEISTLAATLDLETTAAAVEVDRCMSMDICAATE